MNRNALAIALVAALCASPAFAANWIATWAAPPMPSTAASKTIENQTVRQVVRISTGGKRVRVRFSNEYGTKQQHIRARRAHLQRQAHGDHPARRAPVQRPGRPARGRL